MLAQAEKEVKNKADRLPRLGRRIRSWVRWRSPISTAGGDISASAAATVYTNVRKGYVGDCPNVGKLITNMMFGLSTENTSWT